MTAVNQPEDCTSMLKKESCAEQKKIYTMTNKTEKKIIHNQCNFSLTTQMRKWFTKL